MLKRGLFLCFRVYAKTLRRLQIEAVDSLDPTCEITGCNCSWPGLIPTHTLTEASEELGVCKWQGDSVMGSI